MTSSETPLLCLEDLRFGWPNEPDFLIVPQFQLMAGDSVFLEGASGAGKSTLLGLIAGVLKPRSGRIKFFDEDLTQLSTGARDKFRAERMGVIFQLFNLLPYLSMIDNVLLPCRFSAARRARVLENAESLEAEASRLLSRLGLSEKLHGRKTANLSVGQQQRVAAARAFIGSPDLIIADEPTSSVDASTRNALLDLLLEQAETSGAALLFVSHDLTLAGEFKQRVPLAELNTATREPA